MLLLLSFLLNIVLAEPASTEPPVDPEALNTWWKAAGQLRMGDTAYRITQNVQFKDGVCDVNLSSGMVIPVYTGKHLFLRRLLVLSLLEKEISPFVFQKELTLGRSLIT